MTFPKRSFLNKAAFQLGEEDYSWQDIFIAARLSGDWEAWQERTEQGIAHQKRLADLEEEIDPDELQQVCEAFRYERDLISAEEMEAWLQKRELTTEEWMSFIERKYLLENAENPDDILSEYEVSEEETQEAMEIDGICSGELIRYASELAGQVALNAGTSAVPVSDEEVSQFLEDFEEDVQQYPGITRIARVKLGLEHAREKITDEKIRDYIKMHSLDLVRLHLRSMTLPEQEQAQEAALCLREDGERISSVSNLAGTVVTEQHCYLEELDPEIQTQLAGVKQGTSIGPLATATGEFILIYVASRKAPSPDDPDTQNLARQRLLQSVIKFEVNNRIRWNKLS